MTSRRERTLTRHRKLHSMTLTSLSRAMNWMFTGPEMFRASAILAAARFTCVASTAWRRRSFTGRRVADLLLGLHVELLGRQDERGIPRMHAGVLDVLGDGVVHDRAVAADLRTIDGVAAP